MPSGLSATMHFGFTPSAASRLMSEVAAGNVLRIGRDPALAQRLGIGTVQLEALGAWLRLSGLIESNRATVALTDAGALIWQYDPRLCDTVTWWTIHWRLSLGYAVWDILCDLPYGEHSAATLEAALQAAHPSVSAVTVRNARNALVKALQQTPLGSELGIVSIRTGGDSDIVLVKQRVRHEQAPLAAVAYALLDWTQRESVTSASLETLAAPRGPGGRLHMSEGALERYLMDIAATMGHEVLWYSRTSGLNEAYFGRGAPAIAVLRAHFLQRAAEPPLSWGEALAIATSGEDHGDAGQLAMGLPTF